MRKYAKHIVATCLVFGGLMVSDSYAPPGGDPVVGGGSAGCWPPPCIPIDGGISFLIAAGIAFGAKKALDIKA